MSDFDQKNIPVLDDIIDGDGTDNTKSDSIESENNLDLFEDKTTEASTETEPQIDSIDEISDNDVNHQKTTQPAITFNYEETYRGSDYQLGSKINAVAAGTEETQNQPDPTFPLEPLVLERVVKNVVKQIMPDLEQQLRFLIQQSLEDELPKEIEKSATTDTDDS